MNKMVLTKSMCVTGLRSHKLFGDDYNDPRYLRILESMMEVLRQTPGIITCRTGMASGIDLLFGLAVNRFKSKYNPSVELIASIPGSNQTKYYNDTELMIYQYILSICDKQELLTTRACTPELLKARNRHMIDNSDFILAYWDGNRYRSGTYSAVNYAKKNDKTVLLVNPENPSMWQYYHISEKDIESYKQHYNL